MVDGNDEILSHWVQSPAINQGINSINHLRIVGYESNFQFFINGELLSLCIPDDPDASSTPLVTGECRGGSWEETLVDDSISFGRLAVAVVSDDSHPDGIIVDFDNAGVYGPQPIGDE